MNDFKMKVKEKIKLYSNEEYLNSYIKNEYLVENGVATVLLYVKNKDELFDSRTIDNQLSLDNSIYNYIEEKTSMLSNDIKLNLNIICTSLNEKEKERIIHIIKEHYAIELYKIQKEYKKNRIKIIRLLIIGIILLFIYALIAYNTKSKLFIEIFGFLFSFALWEAFENLMYEMSDIKSQRNLITQKLLMEIEFK